MSERKPPLVDASGDTELEGFFVTAEEQGVSSLAYVADAFRNASVGAVAELLAFWVGDEEYAVDILEIQEIIKVPIITDVPRTGRKVLGIISLRGVIVPVLDLRRALSLGEAPVARTSRILVLRADGDPIGVLVDRVTSVVRLEREAIEPMPRSMARESSELLRGVGRIGDRLLIVLEHTAIVALMEGILE